MCGIHPKKRISVNDYQKDRVYLPINGKVYPIDNCIHQIISSLNAGGIPTENCCCGHNQEPGSIILSDGRCIGIFSSLEEFEKLLKYDNIN